MATSAIHYSAACGLRPNTRVYSAWAVASVNSPDHLETTTVATLDLLARHDDLRGLCVVGGGGDGIIKALAQLPERPSICSILLESRSSSHRALEQGVVSLVIDSQPLLIGTSLIRLLVELQEAPVFDPERHCVHVPLQIVTSENTGALGC